MDEILGTEKGIEGLAKFLDASGAFRKTGRVGKMAEELIIEEAQRE